MKSLSKLSSVIERVNGDLANPPALDELSLLSGLSVYQLDRRIHRIFGLTTGQWILKQRLDYAQRELWETNDAIADVAIKSGYADQSTFSRQFRKTTGFTPMQFRKLKGVQ